MGVGGVSVGAELGESVGDEVGDAVEGAGVGKKFGGGVGEAIPRESCIDIKEAKCGISSREILTNLLE